MKLQALAKVLNRCAKGDLKPATAAQLLPDLWDSEAFVEVLIKVVGPEIAVVVGVRIANQRIWLGRRSKATFQAPVDLRLRKMLEAILGEVHKKLPTTPRVPIPHLLRKVVVVHFELLRPERPSFEPAQLCD